MYTKIIVQNHDIRHEISAKGLTLRCQRTGKTKRIKHIDFDGKINELTAEIIVTGHIIDLLNYELSKIKKYSKNKSKKPNEDKVSKAKILKANRTEATNLLKSLEREREFWRHKRENRNR